MRPGNTIQGLVRRCGATVRARYHLLGDMTFRAVVCLIEPERGGEEIHAHQTEDVHHQEENAREIPHARYRFGHGLHQHAKIRPLLGELEDA